MVSDMLLFFSSRRRHTRYIGDWSSDVCSSDLSFGRTVGPKRGASSWRADGSKERSQIGRTSCRERVQISVVAVSLKKKKSPVFSRVAALGARRGEYAILVVRMRR